MALLPAFLIDWIYKKEMDGTEQVQTALMEFVKVCKFMSFSIDNKM